MSDDVARPQLLADIKVVEFAQNIAIPQCGRILAGMGADVVKVEPPGGDAMRFGGRPLAPFEGRGYACVNPDKRSIALDLGSPDARPVIEALFRWADVALVAFKQSDLPRYGIDWDTARELNPRLIHLTHTPFGPEGEYADQGGYDVLAQSMSGMGFSMNRARGDVPIATRPAVNDCGTGIAAALGIVAAIRHRDKTGEGQRVDASLLATAVNLSLPTASHFPQTRPHQTFNDDEQQLQARRDDGATIGELRDHYESGAAAGQRPFFLYFRYYRTADGIMAVAGISRGLVDKFHAATGLRRPPRTGPPDDPEFVAVVDEAEALFRTKTTAEWIATLREVGYPCGRFNLPFEGLADPQVRANWFVHDFEHETIGNYTTAGMPVQFSATPVGFTNPSPQFAEHTTEVLTEIGLDSATIDALAANNTIVIG